MGRYRRLESWNRDGPAFKSTALRQVISNPQIPHCSCRFNSINLLLYYLNIVFTAIRKDTQLLAMVGTQRFIFQFDSEKKRKKKKKRLFGPSNPHNSGQRFDDFGASNPQNCGHQTLLKHREFSAGLCQWSRSSECSRVKEFKVYIP